MSFKISYSKISDYRTCPLKYKFRYIDKKPRKDRPYLSMGESIHLALKHFLEIDKKDRVLENLHNLLRKNWIRKGYKDEIEERQYGLEGLEMLSKFFQSYDPNIKTVCTESFFEAKIEDITLVAKIDRVDEIDDGVYEIIDYKTGRERIDPEALNEDLQLTMYYLIFKYSRAIEPKKLTLYYLREGKKFSTKRTPWKAMDEFLKIKRWAKTIEEAKNFRPNPGKHCSFCDYTDLCDAHKDLLYLPSQEDLDDLPF
jgi:DNA helicase-2/ATP-dependent DNA helicase PcrA